MPLKSLQGQHQYKVTLTQLNSFNLTFIDGFILRQSNKMLSCTSQSLKTGHTDHRLWVETSRMIRYVYTCTYLFIGAKLWFRPAPIKKHHFNI